MYKTFYMQHVMTNFTNSKEPLTKCMPFISGLC